MNMNESTLKKLIKNIIKEIYSDDEGLYPTATVQVSTLGGTNVLLYKGNAKEKNEAISDVNYKTSTKFNNILSYVRNLKAKEATGEKISLERFTTTDRDVISILLNLDNDELNQLETEKIVVTNNIPNEILDLTGKHIPTDEPLDEPEEHPDEKLIKYLEKRLAKYLPMDDYQRPALLKLLAKLKGELKKESGDPFRDIVKKNASLYRDNELSRREKENYARWLAVHKPDELKNKLKALKKKK